MAVVQGNLALLPGETKTTNNRGTGETDLAIPDKCLPNRHWRTPVSLCAQAVDSPSRSLFYDERPVHTVRQVT